MRKNTESFAGTVAIVLVLLAVMGGVIWAFSHLFALEEGALTVIAVIYITAAAAVAIGLIWSLYKRKKELDSGEEDEARKY